VSCGAPLASDQRYCLECGARRVPMSSVLSGEPPPLGNVQAPSSAPSVPPTPPMPPGGAPAGGPPQRNTTLTVIAGVGVLLLAMGVGVLIGRAGAAKQSPAPAQVITLSSPTSTAASTGSTEASFTGDWPSGTSGYTVQLQTLPQPGTAVSAVEAAKTAASAKGAKSVGALKSEEFSSLTAGSYVIYSGDYHKKPEAEKALAGLKKSFPGAKVVKVSNGESSSSAGGSGSSSGAVGSSVNHPAPPSVLNSLKGTKGKSYEEKSKNLPDVVETG
jgi:hypothetical protein